MENSSPIMICGAPGSGTSVVTRLLRYAGIFGGADAGPIQSRKFHESLCFQNANKRLLTATIDFPYAPKTRNQFKQHFRLVEEDQNTLLDLIDKECLLDEYWGNQKREGFWGWKDPRNSANVLVWRRLFPDLRLLTIHKRWRWRERKKKGTLAGDWFRMELTRPLIKFPTRWSWFQNSKTKDVP